MKKHQKITVVLGALAFGWICFARQALADLIQPPDLSKQYLHTENAPGAEYQFVLVGAAIAVIILISLVALTAIRKKNVKPD